MSGAGGISQPIITEFIPAKSLKEAEEFALNNIKGVKRVDWGGYSVEQANAVIEELSVLQDKYGQLGSLESIKIRDKRFKFAGMMRGGKYLELRVDITNAYHAAASKMGLTKAKPSLAGLVDHEIGHALTPDIFDIKSPIRPVQMTKFGKKLDEFFELNKDRIKTEISDYGATARHEFVAEVFAHRENGTAPKWAIDFFNKWNI